MCYRRIVLLATIWSVSSVIQAEEIDFNRDIRPILSDKCFYCHGPDPEHRQADLRLDLQQAAHEYAIVPGSLEESEVVARITSDDADTRMPPPDSGKELSAAEIELLQSWIQQGAVYKGHWAFELPQKSKVNASVNDWAKNPIDSFVWKHLQQHQLQPRPEADRRTLIRRLTFDLTGLPPTIEEVNAFVNDTSPQAYEKVVDRLLVSPHYGERMAVMWLDAARYGDTSVFHADGPRDMWAWRDWVVKAYNQNLPFDQFSTYQLAGDLLPDATLEQQLASGFNRNNATTDEGGVIPEEYRVEYAVDRVKTTSNVWLGLTMECAQCHDHKYDPITLTDYYSMYAFFNISADKGMQTRRGNEAPILEVPNEENLKQLPTVRKELELTHHRIEQRVGESEPAFQEWLAAASADARDNATSGRRADVDPIHRFAFEEEGNMVTCLFNDSLKGKFNGKVTRTAGHAGQGLKLEGGYVEVGDIANFERTDAFTMSAWVKPTKSSNGAIYARMDSGSGYRGYDLWMEGNRIGTHIIHRWPDNAVKVVSKKALKPNEWQHVAVTYDGTSKASGVTIYVNGEKWEWAIQQDGLTETIQTPKTFLIGTRHGGGNFTGEVDEISLFNRVLSEEDAKSLAADSPLKSLLAIAPEDRTIEQVKHLKQIYLTEHDQTYQDLIKQRDQLTAKETQLQKPLTTVMVMSDMAKPRDTFILNRGAYDSPTETKVFPNTPAALPPMASDAPQNRLGLARWLFQEDNPLTARVAVNRYWQLFFGTGLVSTPTDFGSQGDFPSHPELLDWLAVDFVESGWDVKRMVKQIVMSSTYRQSSQAPVDLYQNDPKNRLLARGPRFRLQGEFIRDNALFLSGLLVDKLGGPGVKPYQPPGLWAEVGLGGNPKFKQDQGEALYRRSLYTYWKRSAPPPNMQIFDAPTREKCTVARPRTNTPLQALVALNDVQFVEAARHLAKRLMQQEGDDAGRIDYALQLTLARSPSPQELSVLNQLLSDARQTYAKDEEGAKALLSMGDSPREESLPLTEHAAWTILASTILNLDETLNRG